MPTTLQHAKPITLLPGEGDAHSLLTHTLVWKVTAKDANGHYAMFELIDTAGGSAPVHSHPWEETFYILQGEIEIQVGERLEILKAGAVSHIPANAVHAFQIRSAIARVLVVVSSATAEAFYREAGAKITSLPPDAIVFQDICTKYGLQLQ